MNICKIYLFHHGIGSPLEALTRNQESPCISGRTPKRILSGINRNFPAGPCYPKYFPKLRHDRFYQSIISPAAKLQPCQYVPFSVLLSLSLFLTVAPSLFLFRFLSRVLPVRHSLHTIARTGAYFIMTAIEINVARNANSIINYGAMIVRHFVVYVTLRRLVHYEFQPEHDINSELCSLTGACDQDGIESAARLAPLQDNFHRHRIFHRDFLFLFERTTT